MGVGRSRGLRRSTAVLLLPLLCYGCNGESDATPDPLPPNPADWVCETPEEALTAQDLEQWCRDNPDRGTPAGLPQPPPLSRLAEKNAFEVDVLQPFLREREYVALGWRGDVGWRFTGPYVGTIGAGKSYGVHPAVRIYYSPEIVDWLCGGRRGDIPDGAMIVKEMHRIEPCLDVELDADGCMVIRADPEPGAWAVMIKARAAAFDGWYWGGISPPPADPPGSEWEKGNPPIFDRSAITSQDFFRNSTLPPTRPDPLWYPTGYVFENPLKLSDIVTPFSDYGTDCINCHASAVAESTFSDLENLIGPGIRYKGFEFAAGSCAPMNPGDDHTEHVPGMGDVAQAGAPYRSPFTQALPEPLPGFTDFFGQLPPVSFAEAWEQRLPAETYDHVVAPAHGAGTFVTSDQCAPCHDATLSNSSLPNMILQQTEADGGARLLNLSPYGEWKASPMGLAGRDPIFLAQLQSETNIMPPAMAACIENTCLHCHGVMGQRQLAIDTSGADDDGCKQLFGIEPPPEVPFGRPFRRAMVTQWPEAEPATEERYGALARDGISCTVCHRISERSLGNENTYTGNFVTGPAGEVYGPYEDDTIVPKSMENALDIEPRFGRQILESDLCATCHNILLPVFANDGTPRGYRYEQATSLEWGNSDFGPGRAEFLSCQDCHMPTSFGGTELSFAIANIESSQFAPTTHRLPDEDVDLTVRDRFPRHALHGLNVFLNQMFQQFPILLGYRQISYQTGTLTVPPLITGFASMLEMAQNKTAAIAVRRLEKTADGKLRAEIEVTNKAGHFLPSGVSFRRVFLEVLVLDAQGNTLWASGRTNRLGAILDGRTQNVLPSEAPVPVAPGQCSSDPDAPFQPHYQIVQREDQVQIYQELDKDSDGVLTTSFLRRVETVKDNRLRPVGFDPAVFAASPSPFIRELAEIHGEARLDPHYTDPKLTGSDQIEYLMTLDAGDLAKVDHIEATLYSQAIPPSYLQQRFRDANCGAQAKDDIERLFHLTSHLDVESPRDQNGEAPMKGWKLRLTGTSKRLGG